MKTKEELEKDLLESKKELDELEEWCSNASKRDNEQRIIYGYSLIDGGELTTALQWYNDCKNRIAMLEDILEIRQKK